MSESERAPKLGDRVRSARTRVGWSRETLAHNTGLSWSGIEQIESGRRGNPHLETLASLARALGVSLDYLVSGAAPPPMLAHHALFYEDEPSFLAAALPFVAEGLDRSEAVLVVTASERTELLSDALGRAADPVEFADAETWYTTPVHALDGYLDFLDRKLPDVPWVRVVGEPVWVGRSTDQVRLWHEYESLLNVSFANTPASVVCPYDMRSSHPDIIETARRTHPGTLERGVVRPNETFEDPGAFVLSDPPWSAAPE